MPVRLRGRWARHGVKNRNVLPSEAESLERTYGPLRPGANLEEWIIRDHFNDRRNGFFIDIGANHYKAYSNT